MDPLETLSNEHGLIRQFLDNLSMASDHIENGRRPSAAFFEKAFDFASNFTDGFHHFKEEHVLFVRLAEKRKGEVDAQLEVLQHQHNRGRSLVGGMKGALDGYVAHDPGQTAALLENMSAFASLLRHHIHTEDHVFFPMVAKELTKEEHEQLQVEFDRAREKAGQDAFEESHKLVVDMGSMLTHS